jgi:hypothetical protein
LNKLTESEAAYVAGIVDGEGCIYVNAKKTKWGFCSYDMSFRLCLTDKPTIYWLLNTVGVGNVYKRARKAPHRNAWSWEMGASGMRWLLPQIQPFSQLKRRQIKWMLELLELKSRYTFNTGNKKGRKMCNESRQRRLVEMIKTDKRKEWK